MFVVCYFFNVVNDLLQIFNFMLPFVVKWGINKNDIVTVILYLFNIQQCWCQ